MNQYGKIDGIIGKVVLAFILLVVLWPVIGMGIFYLGFAATPAPPKPSIKKGEFPFELVYELQGKRYTIQDTVVCRYKGAAVSAADGKSHRIWSAEVESTGEEYVVLHENGKESTVLFVGSGAYYMGESQEPDWRMAFMTTYNNGMRSFKNTIPEAQYAEIISWKPSPPIVNTFGK